MDSLQVIARFSIHDGRLADFKEFAAACMRSVRENDSGTLQYDWYFSQDESECVVIETYRDSAALIEHIAGVGKLLASLEGIAEIDIQLYGNPSKELLDLTAANPPKLYTHYQSP